MRKFYILTPARVRTGGPELCHQMCAALNSLGESAYVYYEDGDHYEPVDAEPVEDYMRYGTEHVKSMEEYLDRSDGCEHILICPEARTRHLRPLSTADKIVLWWMSVDNYFKDPDRESIESIVEMVDLHLVQSEYARQFLLKECGVDESKIIYLSDYINEDYGKFVLPGEYRKQIGIVNPAKGFEVVKPLIEKTVNRMEWIPLVKMNREEVIVSLQIGKVYVDFGNHPGKDRIPREAAACGCCIITNKKGSAAYYEDVPIPDQYKFENPEESIEEIEALIIDICENYEEHKKNFEVYREWIKQEKARFFEDVKIFADRI